MKFYQFIFCGLMFYSISGYAQQDIIYKRGNFLIETSDSVKLDFIIKGQPYKKKLISRGDTLFENQKYLVLGNDDKAVVRGIFKKYKLKYKFSNFLAPIYSGKLVAPNFKTDTAAYMFRTQIRNQCKHTGVNFAGHYTIVEWGCGSPCQQIAIVDRLNGTIYYSHIPEIDNMLAFGLRYKANSRLIIINSDLLEEHIGYVNCGSIGEVVTIEWNHKIARRLPE